MCPFCGKPVYGKRCLHCGMNVDAYIPPHVPEAVVEKEPKIEKTEVQKATKKVKK